VALELHLAELSRAVFRKQVPWETDCALICSRWPHVNKTDPSDPGLTINNGGGTVRRTGGVREPFSVYK
jgi:hypothetical protein